MDDMWASRIHSSNHFSAHPTSGNQAVLDNSEVKDDAKTYFTCPFCYMDTDLSLVCDHLQEEHCFDLKNAVCPVCALNLGKDVAGHFKVHHSNSIKKRSHKSGFWNFYAGRNTLGGLTARNGLDNANGSAPDPLLSPFLFSMPYSESKENQSQHSFSAEDVSFTLETESSKPTQNQIELKEDSEEMKQRAEFCQHLIFSTIL
ncbi:protein DEHYDRATION-INDUCED 19 homolog 5-like [Silene latifolia]|uniref:protein DEHYDRATION-INDUCED 19 homolog 5-like n=1 Tax=Silene latifolia TaxID=37657 RepID=UPI003D77EC89